MGKSNKKVKSDRVNVLRKQYDAFLEEDKKRKERNDYILGRLDKMRVTTALVLRQRVASVPKLVIEPPAYYDRPSILKQKETELLVSRRNLSLVPMAPSSGMIDEGDILRKISEKYILIPKLPQRIEHDLPRELPEDKNPVDKDEADWKSKYDILAQLKKNEKESDNPITERQKLGKTDFPDRNDIIDTDVKVKPTNKRRMSIFPNEIPERDVSVSSNLHHKVKFNEEDKYDSIEETNLPIEAYKKPASIFNDSNKTHNTPDYNGGVYDTNPSNVHEMLYENVSESDYNLEAKFNDMNLQPVLDTPVSQIEQNYDHPDEYAKIPHEIINQKDNHVETPQYDQTPIQLEAQSETNVTPYYETKVNTIQMTNKDNVVQEAVNNNIVSEHEVTQENIEMAKNEYVEETKGADFVPPDNTLIAPHEIDITKTEYVQENFTKEEIPQTNEEHQDTEPTPIEDQGAPVAEENDTVAGATAEIEAFSQENNEMFHQEQANENYQEYNQPAEGEVYNAEYSADQVQYDPNTQYDGYEETPAEQSYPAEYVNNEIAQEQYDAGYEQQYNTTEYNQQQQGYEQQASEIEQQPVQYEQQEGNYEQQPGQYLPQPEGYDQQQLQYEQPGDYEHQPVGVNQQQPQQYDQQPDQLVQQPLELQPQQYEQQGEYEQQEGVYEQQEGVYEQQEGVYEQNPELYEQQGQFELEQLQQQPVYDEQAQEYFQQDTTEPPQQQHASEGDHAAMNQPSPAIEGPPAVKDNIKAKQ